MIDSFVRVETVVVEARLRIRHADTRRLRLLSTVVDRTGVRCGIGTLIAHDAYVVRGVTYLVVRQIVERASVAIRNRNRSRSSETILDRTRVRNRVVNSGLGGGVRSVRSEATIVRTRALNFVRCVPSTFGVRNTMHVSSAQLERFRQVARTVLHRVYAVHRMDSVDRLVHRCGKRTFEMLLLHTVGSDVRESTYFSIQRIRLMREHIELLIVHVTLVC